MGFRGMRVKVKFTRTHISWKPVNPVGGCCVDRRSLVKAVALDEILSAMLPKPDCCPRLGCTAREHSFVIHTFSRKGPRCPNTWRLEEYVLSTNTPEVAKEWVNAIKQRVRDIRDRRVAGRSARLARITWERYALPVFQRAGIVVSVLETTNQDHARDTLELMKSEELAGYQGLVAVGGDGLFQEVVSGLLARRARGDTAAFKIRVGHVPAGSTDAVACTLHGSRCATTAALHIALGDRLSLDTGRVEAADGSKRHFVCQAGYGFMGDVMRFSERLRFLGPSRYDFTGALQYMRLASYRVKLSYREAPSTTADVQQLCTAQCEVCRMAGIRMQAAVPFHRAGAAAASPGPFGGPGPGGGGGSSVSIKVGGVSPRAASGANGAGQGLFRSSPTPAAAAAAAASFATNTADSAPPSGSLGPVGTPGGGPTGGISVWESYGGAHDGDCSAAGVGGSGTFFRVSNSAALGQALPPAASAGSLVGERPSLSQVPQSSAPHSLDVSAADGGGGGADGGISESNTPGKLATAVSAFTTTAAAAAAAAAAACGGGGAAVAAAPAGGDPCKQKDGDGWTCADGEYVSIMCVVTPCRSDKSKRGIIPNGHLSDGRMYLVLVSKCSHFDFLRFLVRLSTRGLVDRCLPFVRVVPVTALKLTPLQGGHRLGGCLADPDAGESAWNVDGELLANNDVTINVARGALEVFARGVETAAGG
ncbi:diacylglycerol kinase [Volvox carteri f. nagariensis]|uniref:Diacylglycerol kinase n=1 Tax=Volvox carteri f. nagariensis TaxID=3068 RepID=D8U1T6_VOLCA|nr:diacylglycerol kinase [Volvox carteri f. nagariensis]EFJ46238.1 diacylglycerol kinase [Volvox carteri f. nagariensis]|eukprot:XP_002952685.1 diacylglycerol kinase [Volvox carteri f. nagariensis]